MDINVTKFIQEIDPDGDATIETASQKAAMLMVGQQWESLIDVGDAEIKQVESFFDEILCRETSWDFRGVRMALLQYVLMRYIAEKIKPSRRLWFRKEDGNTLFYLGY